MTLVKTAAVFLLAAAGHAFAHDAWVEAGGGAWVVRYGHGDKLESYAPAKVRALAAIDARGAALPVARQAGGEAVRATVAGRPALLTLSFDNGVWTKTTEGSKNLPKSEVPGAISATHAVKYGKTVVAWSAAVTRPQGQPLEIVPLAAGAPAAGATLPVQVLFDGKPLAGAKIARAGHGKEAPFEADGEGKALLPVVAGRQMVVVGHKWELPGNAEADSLSAAANLLFEAR